MSSEQENEPEAGGIEILRPAPLSALDYPYSGGWIVAYQDKDKFFPDIRLTMLQMWSAIRGGPSLRGLPQSAPLLRYGNTNDVDMTPDPLQNMYDRNASWDLLRTRLLQPLFRNFYYHGHGESFWIGGDWDLYTNSVIGISPYGTEQSPPLTDGTNIVHSRARLKSGFCYLLSPTQAENPQPYRFVFLDGCSTAAEPGDWPIPFGIGKETNTLQYYENTNRFPYTRPAAFVGWSENIAYSSHPTAPAGEWGGYERYALFRSQWMFDWSYNWQTRQLDDALANARSGSGWISLGTYNRIIRIYGYNDLLFDEYNHRNQWPTEQP